MKKRIPDTTYEGGSVYRFRFRVIFLTYKKQDLFVSADLIQDLEDVFFFVSKKAEIIIESIDIQPCYVNMIIRFSPKQTPLNVIKNLKGNSARNFFRIHPEIAEEDKWNGHLWDRGYYIGTLGDLTEKTVDIFVGSGTPQQSSPAF